MCYLFFRIIGVLSFKRFSLSFFLSFFLPSFLSPVLPFFHFPLHGTSNVQNISHIFNATDGDDERYFRLEQHRDQFIVGS